MRFLHNPVLTACFAVLLVPAALHASAPPRGSWDLVHGLPKGQPIHLTYTSSDEMDARFQGFTSDTLLILKGVEEIRVPRENIEQIEIPSEKARARNVIIGTVFGVAAGAVLEGVWGNHLSAGERGGQRAVLILVPGAVAGGFAAVVPGRKTIYRAPKAP